MEFYRVDFRPGGKLESEAHFRQTSEMIVVSAGTVQLHSGETSEALNAGDSAYYAADVSHCIENPTDQPSTIFLVVKYQT
ncbi:MAG: cupin domain-containing protein [Actinobacteria bacterium]|nr:cupin domain-containing protein [Actinomycetota bacterium]